MTSRRASSSTMSRASSLNSLAVYSILGKETWFERYQETIRGNIVFDTSSLFDVLKDLFDDNLDENAAVHLLSLVESFQDDVIKDADVLEQTIGTLFGLYNSMVQQSTDSVTKSRKGKKLKPKLVIQKKLLITLTSLMINFDDWMRDEESLKNLFDTFVDTLAVIVASSMSLLGMRTLAETLLIHIKSNFGDQIDEKIKKIEKSSTNILSEYFNSQKVEIKEFDMKLIVNNSVNIRNVDIVSVKMLTNILHIMKSETFILGTFSPIIFKPLIHKLIKSSSLFHIHFLLTIYKSHRIELFDSSDEEKLINALIIHSRHPSLSISHRLICLEFCYSFIERLKSHFDIVKSDHDLVNVSDVDDYFKIQSLDGCDSIEKKLKIQLELKKQSPSQLLMKLKQLKTLSLINGNERATKSLYRTLYLYLRSYQDEMASGISEIIESLIKSSPKSQLKEAIKIFNKNHEIRNQVFERIIEQSLNNPSLFGDNVEDIKSAFGLIQLIIKTNYESNVIRNDEQVSGLFHFLLIKSKINLPKLSILLLDTISMAIRFIELDTKSRIVIKECLDTIHKEMNNQGNVTKSSWAQIYLIAISTLTSKEQLQNVFQNIDNDETDNKDFIDKKYSASCPLMINKIGSEIKSDNILETRFELSLDANFKFNEIFGVEICVSCVDQDYENVFETRYLFKDKPQIFIISVPIIDARPCKLSFDAEFSDLSGDFHEYSAFCEHKVSVSDLVMRNYEVDADNFIHKWKDLQSDDNSFETLIRTKFPSIPDLLTNIPLINSCSLADKDLKYLSFKVIPKTHVLGTLKIVDNKTNVHILSSDWRPIEYLKSEIFDGYI